MQAALITFMQMAPNNAEPAAEANPAGLGLRMNSALQSQKTESLFTTILQKGIAVNVPLHPVLELENADISLNLNTDEPGNENQNRSVDVCSLLMQLILMNSQVIDAGGVQNTPDEETVNGILSMIGEIPDAPDGVSSGLEKAASVILENGGKAAEVLAALAATKNQDGRTKVDMPAAPSEAALAGITAALKNALEQNGAATTAVGAETAADAPVNPSAVNEIQSAKNIISQNEVRWASGDDIGANGEIKAQADAKVRTKDNLRSETSAVADKAAVNTEKTAKAAGGEQQSGFGELLSRDKRKSQETAAEKGANQMPSSTVLDSGTTAEKTSAVERALNRFADDLRSVRSGNQEIRIVLEPESLGVLTISVIKTESGISAKIKSDDKEIAAIISDNVHKLILSMQSKGITVEDVDVAYSPSEQHTGFAQHGFSHARDESSRGNMAPQENSAEPDVSNDDVWQTFYSGDKNGDTTVEYRV